MKLHVVMLVHPSRAPRLHLEAAGAHLRAIQNRRREHTRIGFTRGRSAGRRRRRSLSARERGEENGRGDNCSGGKPCHLLPLFLGAKNPVDSTRSLPTSNVRAPVLNV